MAQSFVLTGQAYWTKLVDSVPMYDESKGNEWSIDVTLDQKGQDLIKRLGLEKVIRNKDDDRGVFMTFRRPELKKEKDGVRAPNSPIAVYDSTGAEWNMAIPIGNGSTVKIKFGVFESPATKKFKAILKPVIYEVHVLELKEYKRVPPKQVITPRTEDDSESAETSQDAKASITVDPSHEDNVIRRPRPTNSKQQESWQE